MPFVRVRKNAGSARGGYNPGIRIGLTKRGALYFSITSEVIRNAGWNLVSEGGERPRYGARIDVMEGTGKDQGFLTLVQSDQGYRLSAYSDSPASAYVMSVTGALLQHYVVPRGEQKAQPVDHSIDTGEHTVLLQCPDWMTYDPQVLDDADLPPDPDDPVPEGPPEDLAPETTEVPAANGANGADHGPSSEKESEESLKDLVERFSDLVKKAGLNREQRRRFAAMVVKGR